MIAQARLPHASRTELAMDRLGIARLIEQRLRTIEGLSRVSKPGLRRYTRCDQIPRVLGGLGVAILSTSRGVVSDGEARKQRLGGELICTVY